MSPHEYRVLFEVMAKEISENDLIGAQTLANITQRAQEKGLEVRRDDVRFVLEVVSEADPWFEQGASANLFAGRFRNFVVARCRGQGLNLSADELDLIDAWFAGGSPPQAPAQTQTRNAGAAQQRARPRQRSGGAADRRSARSRRCRSRCRSLLHRDRAGGRGTTAAPRRTSGAGRTRATRRISRASCAIACAADHRNDRFGNAKKERLARAAPSDSSLRFTSHRQSRS